MRPSPPTRYVLMTQVKPGSVVLVHDTYSSTVDLALQFLPLKKPMGYHVVTISHLLGLRAPGSSYGRRGNGPSTNDLTDIPATRNPGCRPPRRRTGAAPRHLRRKLGEDAAEPRYVLTRARQPVPPHQRMSQHRRQGNPSAIMPPTIVQHTD